MHNNYLRNTFAVLLITGSSAVYAQNMAINKSGNLGNVATILDMSDASNAHLGLLLPNVSLLSVTDVTTIPSPPNGLIVYNTNSSIGGGFGVGFYYWSATSTKWLFVSNTGTPGVTTFSGGATGFTPNTATSGAVTLGGILNVANGGSGLGTSPTNGQLLIGNGTGYGLATITSANGTIAITNGAGTIALDIAQQGATSNQVLAWNGTQWAPQNLSSIGFQNLSPGTGISGSTYNGSTAVNDWSVLYGSIANTAVQGNTTFSVTAGTGLSGGGSITEGAGGTITLTNTGVLGVTGTSPISSSGGANPIISFPSWPATNAVGLLTNNGTGGLSWGSFTSLGNITVTNTGGGLSISGSPVSLGGTINVDPNVKTDATLTGNGTTATPLGLASVITAGGPTGSGSVVPVITYNAKGQLTAVSTATITTTSIGMQNLTPGPSLSGSVYNGSTAVSNWAVNYGSTTNTAVQGNTTFTVTAGTGLSGGGSITEGTGGSISLANTGVLATVATAPVVNTGSATSPVLTLGGTTNGVIYATSAASAAVTAASTGANQVLATTTTGGAPIWQSFASLTNNGFILNQTSQQASSNFNISGTGTIGGLATLSAGVTETGGAASINASGANTTTIGNGTNALTENGNYSLNNNNGTATTNIGTGTTTGIVSIAGSSNRVGIGNTTPAASSILDLTNTNATGGTGAAMRWPTNPNPSANIPSPALGDQVYNTTTGCFNFYNGSAWVSIGCPCSSAPAAPTITASCSQSFQGSTITYTSSITTGVSFNWTVTATSGTPTVTGNGTATITVTWPSTGANTGTVILSLSNLCGSTNATLSVPINVAPTISGPSSVSSSSTGNIYTCSITGATYLWSFVTNTDGSTIPGSLTGQSVSVTAGSTAGSFSLQCIVTFGSCSQTATSSTISVTVCTITHGTFTGTSGSISSWTVPCGISQATITAFGAGGGPSTGQGGMGAEVVATISVSSGQVINVLSPTMGGNNDNYSGGGGGGAFVWDNSSSTLYVAAGGGGGGSISCTSYVGGPGSATVNTTNGGNPGTAVGGTGGNGGGGGSGNGAGGGCGWFSNGGNGACGAGGGVTPLGGGNGGTPCSPYPAPGGFGGGGDNWESGCGTSGGGGGYNGGPGGDNDANNTGGGGGSYVIGTATGVTELAGQQAGNGSVSITY